MLSLIRRPLISSVVRAASSSAVKPFFGGEFKGQSFNPIIQTQYASIHSSIGSASNQIKSFDISGSQNSLLLGGSNCFMPNITPVRFLKAFRRKKMNKHKRRKRFDRDYFKYQKYHAKKKAKAENIFRQEMNAMMNELKTFDPLEHIKTTIQTAKLEWKTSVASSGRKKHPHWHELMSLEELYGLKLDDHIDKKAGRPGEEDEAKLKELREAYFKKYSRKD